MKDPAELLFEEYLAAQEYALEYEPDLGAQKRPDYLVRRGKSEAICEVKGFTTPGIMADAVLSPGVAVSRPMKRSLSPIRSQLGAAASQLKPLAFRNLPLVVVLGNPLQAGVELSPIMVIAAMYGDLQAQLGTPNEGEDVFSWIVGRNGRLTGSHAYISAVVTIHQGDRSSDRAKEFAESYLRENPGARPRQAMAALREAAPSFGASEPYFYCHVFECVSGSATRLPPDFFTGPDDTRWQPTANGLTRVR